MPEERRQFVRVPSRFTLSYTIVESKKIGKSLTVDLGSGGVRFVAEHPLAVGALLAVVLRIPDREEPIRFIGKVVWGRPAHHTDPSLPERGTEVGVVFVEIDSKDRAFLLQHAALYAPPPA